MSISKLWPTYMWAQRVNCKRGSIKNILSRWVVHRLVGRPVLRRWRGREAPSKAEAALGLRTSTPPCPLLSLRLLCSFSFFYHVPYSQELGPWIASKCDTNLACVSQPLRVLCCHLAFCLSMSLDLVMGLAWSFNRIRSRNINEFRWTKTTTNEKYKKPNPNYK